MGIKSSIAVAALSVVCAIAPAQAAVFTFEDNHPVSRDGLVVNSKAGQYSSIKTSFDDQTNILNWSSTFTRNQTNQALSNGAWLVLSDGENPKNNVDEYAIMYLDATASTVSIYNYNGKNSANSYRYSDYLGSTALNVIENGPDEVTFEFSLDATDINNSTSYGSEWKGIAFSEEIGLWFHDAAGLHTAYDANGKLLSFVSAKSGWYDTTKALPTTKVPEPGSLAALGLVAAAGVTQLRKRVG